LIIGSPGTIEYENRKMLSRLVEISGKGKKPTIFNQLRMVNGKNHK